MSIECFLDLRAMLDLVGDEATCKVGKCGMDDDGGVLCVGADDIGVEVLDRVCGDWWLHFHPIEGKKAVFLGSCHLGDELVCRFPTASRGLKQVIEMSEASGETIAMTEQAALQEVRHSLA